MKKNYVILLLTLSLVNLNAQITTFPYSEDFESGAAGWTVEGTTTSWELGAPANNVINSAASGNNAWVTNLDGAHSDNEDGWVQSPSFDLSGMTKPVIRLKIWYESEHGYDKATVEYSQNSGTSWVKLSNNGNDANQNNWYNFDKYTQKNDYWSGRTDSDDGSSGWLTASREAPNFYSNIIFRVKFESDALYNDDGFAFDFVEIVEAATYKISNFPYVEGFDGGSYIKGGWKEVATGSAGESWEVARPNRPTLGTAASGRYAWENFAGTNEKSWVESPVFDFTSIDPNSDQFYIKFNIWYDTFNSNNDPNTAGAVLQSSIDSGTTWLNVGGLDTANTVNGYNNSNITGLPGGQALGWSGESTNLFYDGWKTIIMDISQLGGEQDVIFRVAFGSGPDGDGIEGFSFDSIRMASNTCFAGEDSSFYETFTGACSERTFSSNQEFADWAFAEHNANNSMALDTGGVWSPSTFIGYGLYTYTLPANTNCPERSSTFLYNDAAPVREIIKESIIANTTDNLSVALGLPSGKSSLKVKRGRWRSRNRSTPVTDDGNVDFPNTGAGSENETIYIFAYVVEDDTCGIIDSITTYVIRLLGTEETGVDGVLEICEGQLFKRSDLFNALGGDPTEWGSWRDPDGGSWENIYTTEGTYTYTGKNVNGNNTNESSTVEVYAAPVYLNFSVFLQGPYDSNTGLMSDDLRSSGLIETTSPYQDALTVNSDVFNSGGPDGSGQPEDDIVDWIWLELRDSNDDTNILFSSSAFLQRDGDIVDVENLAYLAINIQTDDYYVVITHRNHLGVLSSSSILCECGSTNNIDFKTDSNLVKGGINAIKNIGDGKFALFAGDFNGDGQIQNTDKNAVEPLRGISGYSNADIDMNGEVQNSDLNSVLNPNIGKGQQFMSKKLHAKRKK